jgi:hypothetical protein
MRLVFHDSLEHRAVFGPIPRPPIIRDGVHQVFLMVFSVDVIPTANPPSSTQLAPQ